MMVEVPAAAIASTASTPISSPSARTISLSMSPQRAATSLGRRPCGSAHPAVLHSFNGSLRTGWSGRKVSLCGDAGPIPRMLPLLLGLGLRAVSVAPTLLAATKAAIASIDLTVERAMTSAQPTARRRSMPSAPTSIFCRRARPAALGDAAAPCRGARQEPLLRLADHEPGLSGSGTGAASVGRSSKSAISRRRSGRRSSTRITPRIRAASSRSRTGRRRGASPSTCPISATAKQNRALEDLIEEMARRLAQIVRRHVRGRNEEIRQRHRHGPVREP